MESFEFDDWLSYGLKKGWISEVVCNTHEGPALSDQEMEEFDEWDPCIPVIRVWQDNIIEKSD